jgi:hypothetical protein
MKFSIKEGGSCLPQRTELTMQDVLYHADASARRRVGESAGAEGTSCLETGPKGGRRRQQSRGQMVTAIGPFPVCRNACWPALSWVVSGQARQSMSISPVFIHMNTSENSLMEFLFAANFQKFSRSADTPPSQQQITGHNLHYGFEIKDLALASARFQKS